MKNLDYGIAYAEVLEVLKYISLENYNKIPKNYITYMEENCDENCTFVYNIAIPFEKQDLSDDTKNILAMLYRLFWASDEDKKRFEYVDKQNIQKRKEINQKYSPENVFKNRNSNVKYNNINKEKNEIIEYKENNWIKKLFIKIRSLFKKY